MTEPLKNTDRPKADIKKVDKESTGATQLQPKEPTVLTRGEDTGPTDKQDSNIDPEGKLHKDPHGKLHDHHDDPDEAEFVEEGEYVPPTAEELPQDSLNVAAHNQLRKL